MAQAPAITAQKPEYFDFLIDMCHQDPDTVLQPLQLRKLAGFAREATAAFQAQGTDSGTVLRDLKRKEYDSILHHISRPYLEPELLKQATETTMRHHDIWDHSRRRESIYTLVALGISPNQVQNLWKGRLAETWETLKISEVEGRRVWNPDAPSVIVAAKLRSRILHWHMACNGMGDVIDALADKHPRGIKLGAVFTALSAADIVHETAHAKATHVTEERMHQISREISLSPAHTRSTLNNYIKQCLADFEKTGVMPTEHDWAEELTHKFGTSLQIAGITTSRAAHKLAENTAAVARTTVASYANPAHGEGWELARFAALAAAISAVLAAKGCGNEAKGEDLRPDNREPHPVEVRADNEGAASESKKEGDTSWQNRRLEKSLLARSESGNDSVPDRG